MAIIDRRGITVDAAPSSASSSGPNAGLAIKAPVRVATTANITLSGLQTIDGVALAAEDRVLVKDQSTATENGIYKVSSGNWLRSTDFDSGSEIVRDVFAVVSEGTVNALGVWRLSSSNPITIDSSNLTFVGFISPFSRTVLDDTTSNAWLTTITATRAETGAVAVPMLTKMRERLSATDFGISDSATGAANQTALAAALAAAASLGRCDVYLPSDLFPFAGSVTISGDNVRLYAAGAYQTILNQATMSSQTVIVAGTNCRVEGIGVNYNGTPTSGGDAWTVTGSGCRLSDVLSLASSRGFVFDGANDLHATDLISTNHEINGIYCEAIVGGRLTNIRLNAGNTSRATLGNLQLVDQSEALQITGLEALSGLYSLNVDATVDSFGTRSAWHQLTNCIFDAAAKGSIVNRMRGVTFANCFFSGGRSDTGYHGIEFTNSKDIAILGGQAVNSGKAGLSIGSGCSAVRVVALAAHSNSVTAGSGTNHGIEVAANVSDVAILYPTGGNEIAGGQQGYDVRVAAGTGARVVVRTNSVGGVTGILSHGASGTGNIAELPGTVYNGAQVPFSNDSAALGASGQAWSDLFLATGGVVNWNAGDVTVTHSANALAFAGASSGYSFDAVTKPSADDAAALGASGTAWADLFLASGGVLNWNASDVTITHSANTLTFGGASSGYRFDSVVLPNSSDGAALGSTSLMWSDLFLASGAVVNFNNGNYTLTHAAGQLSTSGNFIVGSNLTVGGDLTKNVTNSQLAFYGGNAFDAGAGIVLYGETHATTPDRIWFVNNNFTTRGIVDQAGNWAFGSAALATNATDGFLYIPTCAGTPTGAPTAFTGRAAMIYDTTNNKWWIYNGSWRGVVLT